MRFFGLLAVPEIISGNAKLIAICAVCVLCAIAFIVGYVKSASKIGWGAFRWVFVCGISFFAIKKFADKVPVNNVALFKKYSGETQFFGNVSIVLAACLAVGLILGIFALIARPKVKKNTVFLRDEGDPNAELRADGEVYESEKKKPSREIREAKQQIATVGVKPLFINRLFGAIIATVNTVAILCAVFATAYVVLKVTPLQTKLSAVYSNAVVAQYDGYLSAFTFDALLVAVLFASACAGYANGFLRSFRTVLTTVGLLVASVLAFYLPYSAFAQKPGFLSIIDKLNVLFAGFFSKFEKISAYADKIGKLCTGALLEIVFICAIVLLGFLLKGLRKCAVDAFVLRFIDGVIGFVVAFAFALVIVAFVVVLVYLFEYFAVGSFRLSSLWNGDSFLMKDLYETVKTIATPILDKLATKA